MSNETYLKPLAHRCLSISINQAREQALMPVERLNISGQALSALHLR